MEWILSWVKNGLLFGVFASVILMLCPNKVYQKHVGMVVGMLFILVMLHPLMIFFDVDSETYASYIRNFLMLENDDASMTDESRSLYENSVEKELTAVFLERGYPIKSIFVNSDSDGNVTEVVIAFSGEVSGLENIEQYLKRLFGKGVDIRYESR